ncbi:Os01g0654800 [Oryza sativa Japonica Group]|uniref:Os01g0654800 protein n=1 Tax=Oryza sativa subsp. japonica TaxID=39947 RepID=A0A0P0V611_ORYSJ|nr:hypothetical protein EE612_004742 [Oryza sativa]BAS73486.1 Os01g0654800 [Oryza sativa Japonica Group]
MPRARGCVSLSHLHPRIREREIRRFGRRRQQASRVREMALTNLVLGAAVLAAAALLFATDIRKSGAMFRRNARKIWAWLDEEMKSASAVSR